MNGAYRPTNECDGKDPQDNRHTSRQFVLAVLTVFVVLVVLLTCRALDARTPFRVLDRVTHAAYNPGYMSEAYRRSIR
jgi:hypothetical protein